MIRNTVRGGANAARSRPDDSILVLRFHSLGDVILATGIVRTLEEHGRVTIVTEERYRPVFLPRFAADQVLPREAFEQAPRPTAPSFDRAIDLQGTPGSSRLAHRYARRTDRIDGRALARRWIVWWGDRFPRPRVPSALARYASAAGLDPDREFDLLRPVVEVSDEDVALARRLAPGAFDRDATGVALLTGASRRTKRWPAGSFAELAARLAAEGLSPWWIEDPSGAPSEALTLPPGVPCWRLPLPALKGVLSRAALTVACDSGPMHLSAALGRPTLGLFTSTVVEFGFAPIGTQARVAEVTDLACRPCGVHGRGGCWLGHWRCQRDLEPRRVAREALDLLQAAGTGVALPGGDR